MKVKRNSNAERELLLQIAEDPDNPGTIDIARLEEFMQNLEGKVIDGLTLVSGISADGEKRWWVETVSKQETKK